MNSSKYLKMIIPIFETLEKKEKNSSLLRVCRVSKWGKSQGASLHTRSLWISFTWVVITELFCAVWSFERLLCGYCRISFKGRTICALCRLIHQSYRKGYAMWSLVDSWTAKILLKQMNHAEHPLSISISKRLYDAWVQSLNKILHPLYLKQNPQNRLKGPSNHLELDYLTFLSMNTQIFVIRHHRTCL